MKAKVFPLLIAFMLALSLWPVFSTGQALSYDSYNDYQEVKATLEWIAEEHSEIAELIIIGHTWEGRDIMALRLTDNPLEEEAGEPDVLIMGGHHAKELPSVEVPMYVLEFLVGNYSSNYTVKELVDSRDIWFVPLLNPDGREYVLETGEEWRKNRRPIDTNGDGSPDGIGVDLNRNYEHLWGELPGTSHNIWDNDYCGPSAFSENETQAIRDLAKNQEFTISLSYHSYGQLVYYPWNNGIDTLSPDGDLLKEIAHDLGDRNGYTPMQGISAYPTTGDSDDWLYSEGCLPFTIELATEFHPPAEQIEALCKRNLDAALYAIDIADDPERALLPEWTFMVYMASDVDNDLADEALVDLNEMEVAGSTDDLNIVVLYDGQNYGDSMIMHVQKDTGGMNTQIISPVVDDLGIITDPPNRELDMSDPELLGDFAQWAMENYPAQKYMLDIWGHGNGVLDGFAEDKNNLMYLDDVSEALDSLDIDIVGFDACSMGHMEMAKELDGIADILIGSEALEPLEGWDYAASLQSLAEESSMQPSELAATIVDDFLGSTSESYKTLAALDIELFNQDFLPAMDEFCAVSMDFAYQDYDKIWNARNNSDTFTTDQDAVDFYEFLGNLVSVSEPVSKRIEGLQEMEDKLIIRSGTGSAHQDADSMAVYFPSMNTPLPQDYLEIDFAQNLWDDYLVAIKAQPEIPEIQRISTFTKADNTDNYDILAEMGISSTLELVYRVNGGNWAKLNMTPEDGIYTAGLPGQANGSFVEYYFSAPEFNITEPYEVKWGSAEYFNFTVNATCDAAILGLEVTPSDNEEGNVTAFRANCTNLGPDKAHVNVSLSISDGQTVSVIGWEEIDIQTGEFRHLEWNWTAEAGHWNATAMIEPLQSPDTEPGNNNLTVGFYISPADVPAGADLELLQVLLLILAVGCIPLIYFAWAIRNARGKRRVIARKRIDAARQLLDMAQEFGGDISQANIALVKAEVALERGDLKESERLAREAKDMAMMAVAVKEEK